MKFSRKEIILVLLVAILGGCYVCFFTGWFRPQVIRIEHVARPLREAWTGGGQRIDPTGQQVNNVSFSLHQNYRLTSVQVFRATELEAGHDPHQLWHLVAPSGSKPVNTIAYGVTVPGMASAIPGIDAEPLEPGVPYRLVVRAGAAFGTNNFDIPARPAAAR